MSSKLISNFKNNFRQGSQLFGINQEPVKKRSVSSSLASRPARRKTSSKSTSKHSVVDEIEPAKSSLPPVSEKGDSSDSDSIPHRKASSPYLPPGAELPCLCLYDNEGRILKMKALCPEHGYMVRRGTGFSCSDGEDDGEYDNYANGQLEGDWED